jgi:hypothetical protein
MTENTEEQSIQVPMVWGDWKNTQTTYANHLFITHQSGEFYLVFGELSHPMVIQPTQESIPDRVEITPVARIALTPETMVRFAEVIASNVNKFLETQEHGESDGE